MAYDKGQLRPITPYFNAVYYSNFWYSRFYGQIAADFGGNVVENEIDRHRRELRLMALFFEEIYVPRTHLLTQSFGRQGLIAQGVLDSAEFCYLRERGVIRVSSFPGLDAAQDNERIVSRGGLTKAVTYPRSKSELRKIPIDDPLPVNSINESESNTISLKDFGDFIRNKNPALAGVYLEIVKRANIDGIPFFHEAFVRSLRDTLPDSEFETIWKATNSIYLSTGAADYPQILPCYNDEIESLDFRFAKHLVDRYLFSFPSLYTFCSIFLSGDVLNKLLYRNISISHDILYRPDEAFMVRSFRRGYQRLVGSLSEYTRLPPFRAELNQTVIRSLYELHLDGGFQRRSATTSAILDDLTKAAKGADVSAGVIAEVLRATTRAGSGLVRDYMRRRRVPEICEMMDALRKDLKLEQG